MFCMGQIPLHYSIANERPIRIYVTVHFFIMRKKQFLVMTNSRILKIICVQMYKFMQQKYINLSTKLSCLTHLGTFIRIHGRMLCTSDHKRMSKNRSCLKFEFSSKPLSNCSITHRPSLVNQLYNSPDFASYGHKG